MTAVVETRLKLEDILSKDISEAFPKKKRRTVFQGSHTTQENLPCLIKNPMSCSLESTSRPTFSHAYRSSEVHIFHQLGSKSGNAYIENENRIFQRIYRYFQDCSFNIEYQKTFIPITVNEIPKERSAYVQFLQKLNEKVLTKIYGRKVYFSGNEISEKDSSINFSNQESQLIEYDLFNNAVLKTVFALENILNRVTDDELSNVFCLMSHPFVHPVTTLLSPAALAVSFFNHRLVSLTKVRAPNEQIYSEFSLPRVTYLNLSGMYSEIDIDVLNGFSKNIQTIMVYDQSTGGPKLTRSGGMYKLDEDFRHQKRHYQEVSDKILLLPLNKASNEGKSYGSLDILNIIEEIVIKSILKFAPSYIVLNCSLIFDQENQTPFSIDAETLSKIVNLLNQVGNHKVIVYPFKLPSLNNPESKQLFQKSLVHLRKDNERKRLESLFEQFGVQYNEFYFQECFINILESLGSLKDKTFNNKGIINKRAGSRPLKNEMLYFIGRVYKDHPYYNFLYAKSFGILTHIVQNHIQQPLVSIEAVDRVLDKIVLLNYNNQVGLGRLIFEEEGKNELLLTKDSQYLVDYANFEEPIVYIFNARTVEQGLFGQTKMQSPLSHFAITYDSDTVFEKHFEPFYFNRIQIEGNKDIPRVRDFGMCNCESFAFQVYGTYIEQTLDSTQISYFDFAANKSYQLQIQNTHGEILPRHSVTACSFKKNDIYYLYIFGGQVQPNTKYNGRNLGSLDIIDIIEVYTTKDPESSRWDYTILPKNNLFEKNTGCFIPYKNSFAYYDKEDDRIFVMGGTIFKNSIQEWTFPVFEFSATKNQFTSFNMFLNDRKNSEALAITKGENRAIAVAIADRNKNFWYNSKEKVFTFLVPCKETKSMYTIYSYEWAGNKCEFLKVDLIEKDREEILNFDSLKGKGNNQDKFPLKLSQQIGYLFGSVLKKKILLEFVRFRLKQGEEVPIETLQNWLKEQKDENKIDLNTDKFETFNQEIIQERKDKKKKYKTLELMECLLQKKEIQAIFINCDNKIRTLEEYLTKQADIGEQICNGGLEESVVLVEKEGVSMMSIDISAVSDGSMGSLVENQMVNKPSGVKSPSFIGVKEDKVQNMEQPSEGRKIESISKSNMSFVFIDNGQMVVEDFKDCLTSTFTYQAFFNGLCNSLYVLFAKPNGEMCHRDMRLKVPNERGDLDEISFGLSASSISLHNGAVICYIDQEFKKSHPHIYREYKNWVLYANISQAISDKTDLIFRRLFALTSDESIFKRCLLMSPTDLFLFGGKSVRYKSKKNAISHKNVAKYDIMKLKEVSQQVSFIKDPEAEDMEKNSGECVGVVAKDYLFVCQKKNPKEIEIFNMEGMREDGIKFGFQIEDWSVHLNLVNLRGKEEILVTMYILEKDMKFGLIDVKEKKLEEIKLKQKETEEMIPSPILYSGYEFFQSNSSQQALTEIQIYNFRGDTPKVIAYEIDPRG